MAANDPQEIIKQGYSLIKNGEFQKADDLFSALLKERFSSSDNKLLNSMYIACSTSNYLLGNDAEAFYDACKAIETDQTQFEGYLRRSNAFLFYSLFDQSISDMKKAIELCSDQQVLEELNSRLAFNQKLKQVAMQMDSQHQQSFFEIRIPEDFTLAAAKEFGKMIFDNKKVAAESIQKLFRKLKDIFQNESKSFEENNLIGHLSAPKITVLGRIDGNYGRLYAFFDKNGYPSPDNVYLINGNFIGKEDLKTLLILLLFKVASPLSIYFTKGLFETNLGSEYEGDQVCGKFQAPNFIRTQLKLIESDFGAEAKNDLEAILSALPLCYIVNDKTAVSACGLPIASPEAVWGQYSDFSNVPLKINGFPIFCFGEEDVERFASSRGIQTFVFSSKVVGDGVEKFLDGKVINVSLGKTDRQVLHYKLGYATITRNESGTVDTNIDIFNFFPLEVHYDEENMDYYEGVFFRLRKYTKMNPAASGLIRIKAISEDFIPVSETIDTSIYGYSYMSVPSPGSWIVVDFGPRKITLEHYMIESAPLNRNNDHMKTWKILGSDDLQQWSQIDLRENIEELNQPLGHKVFKIDDDKRKPYRFIQILQHEKNHRGNWNLCLNHFDFFGVVQ